MIRAYDDYGNVVDMVEHDKQIKAEAIDEFLHSMEKVSNYARPVGWTKFIEIIPMSVVKDIAEGLKGE